MRGSGSTSAGRTELLCLTSNQRSVAENGSRHTTTLLFIKSPTPPHLSLRPVSADKAPTSVCVNRCVLGQKRTRDSSPSYPTEGSRHIAEPGSVANRAPHKGTVRLFRRDRAPLLDWQSLAGLQIVPLLLAGATWGRWQGSQPPPPFVSSRSHYGAQLKRVALSPLIH